MGVKLHVDLETLQLIQGPGLRGAVNSLRFKRGDAARVQVVFLRNGVTPAIIGDPDGLEIQFGIKPRNQYDRSYLVHSAEWSMPSEGDETPSYSCSISFNTEELNSALNIGSVSAEELSEITLMGEITWRESGGEPMSTRTFLVIVENDVNRGTEGVPVAADPAYPLPQQLALVDQVVRFDTVQTLTPEQQELARANIGVPEGGPPGNDDYETYWRRQIQKHRPAAFANLADNFWADQQLPGDGEFVEFIYRKGSEYAMNFILINIEGADVFVMDHTGTITTYNGAYSFALDASLPDDSEVRWACCWTSGGINSMLFGNGGTIMAIDVSRAPAIRELVSIGYSGTYTKAIIGLQHNTGLVLRDPVSVDVFGSGANVAFTQANMEAEDLDHLFETLPDGADGHSVLVMGNPGVAICDPSIATAKGYIVATAYPEAPP